MYDSLNAIKIVFTTSINIDEQGVRLEAKKLHVRSIYFDHAGSQTGGMSLSNEEFTIIKQEIVKAKKMSAQEFDQYAQNVVIEEFVLKTKRMLKEHVKGKQKVFVEMSRISKLDFPLHFTDCLIKLIVQTC